MNARIDEAALLAELKAPELARFLRGDRAARNQLAGLLQKHGHDAETVLRAASICDEQTTTHSRDDDARKIATLHGWYLASGIHGDRVTDLFRNAGKVAAVRPAEAAATQPDAAADVDVEREAIVTEGPMRAGPRPLVGVTGAALAIPPPPVVWTCRDLQLGPGRPFMLSGHGGSGKTWIAIDLVESYASGKRALDSFDMGQGPVAHLNFEMSHGALLGRYQRVANGRGLDLATLPIHLFSHAQLEGFNLLASNAAAKLIATLLPLGRDGLAIVDSLRAAIPGADENSSDVRRYLDTLLEVSEATGWALGVIHHEGKPAADGTRRDAMHRARGSSGLNDALDTSWSLVTGLAGGVWRLEQGKASLGSQVGPYHVRLNDFGDTDPSTGKSTGVRFEHIPPEQAAQLAGTDEASFKALVARVVDYVRENPDKATAGALSTKWGKRNETVSAALRSAAADGAIFNFGTKTQPKWRVKE